jgi:hypothetical protein
MSLTHWLAGWLAEMCCVSMCHCYDCHFGCQVEKLGAVLGLPPAEHTCETAGYFWLLHVLSR